MKNRCNALTVTPEITLYHTGPALDHGPLPSLFYFALSGPDSLCLDPFNQPIQFLQGKMIRIFSLTLPGHENELPATQAMQLWAQDFQKGTDCVTPFLEQVQQAVDFAIREKFVDPHKMATGGLSRGGYIAAHLAALDTRFRHLLAFAPLTRLSSIREFSDLHLPLADSLDLIHLASLLADRHIRFYIGNHDTRVGTRHCFDFITAIAEKKKSNHAELFISPSLGHMGHGTSPEIFRQGALWIASQLGI